MTIDAVNQSTSGRRTRNLNIFGAGNSSGISLWNYSQSQSSIQANAIRTDDEGNFVVEINGNSNDVGFIISDSATTVNGERYFNAGIGTDNPDADAVHPDNSARFMAGIVTAREYYGTFKGTLENTVVSSLVTINGDGDNGGDTGTHYIHMGSQTSGSDGVEVDSTGLVYKNSQLGIGTDDPKELLDVYSTENSTISVRSGSNSFSSIGLVEASTTSSNSFGNSGSFGFRLGYDGSTNRFKIASGENATITDRLVISRGDGNVSIGDPNPDADTVSSSNTARLMVGIVTAREYYGTFKGDIGITVPATTIQPAGTDGAVQFNDGGSLGGDNTKFSFADTSNRLGIGTAASGSSAANYDDITINTTRGLGGISFKGGSSTTRFGIMANGGDITDELTKRPQIEFVLGGSQKRALILGGYSSDGTGDSSIIVGGISTSVRPEVGSGVVDLGSSSNKFKTFTYRAIL